MDAEVRQTSIPQAGWALTPASQETASMTRVLHDLSSGARSLRRSPGFAAAAVLMLALGIGVNATVFSWLNAVLLSFSYPDFHTFRDLAGFTGLVARSDRPFTLVVPGESPGTASAPERAWSEVVSDNFFPVLGVIPVAGRTFVPVLSGILH